VTEVQALGDTYLNRCCLPSKTRSQQPDDRATGQWMLR